jgi:lambda repressor-like predicted transcriptional regulator
MFHHEQVKAQMRRKGYSYRSAAAEIGKSYQWVFRVLNGQDTSGPVLKAISNLPSKAVKRAR